MQAVSSALRSAIDNGNPQRFLIVFASGDEFSNEDIVVSAGVHYRAYFNSETDLTIGLCPSAEISFTMLNDLNQLANFEFGEFTAYMGAAITEGTPTEEVQRTYTERGRQVLYAFTPLGVFNARRPDVIKKLMIEITANDRMTLLDKDMPSTEQLQITFPVTALNLLEALCTYIGVPLGSDGFENSDVALTEWPESFDSSTVREVVGRIAELACCNALFDRNGELRMTWFRSTSKHYDEHDYTDFTPTWYTTAQIDRLHIRNRDSTAELVLGQGSNAYMIQDNPFLRQPEPEETTPGVGDIISGGQGG